MKNKNLIRNSGHKLQRFNALSDGENRRECVRLSSLKIYVQHVFDESGLF